MVYRNMECDDVRQALSRWSRSADDPADASLREGLQAHLAGCASCGKRYGALLALLDARLGPLNTETEFVDRTMRLVRREAGGRVPKAAPRLLPLAAAALVAIAFLAGYLTRGLAAPPMTDTAWVTFRFSSPSARSVELVGSFGQGAGDAVDMKRGPFGAWTVRLVLPKDGVYTYNFLVDSDTVVADPAAGELVSDGFGGTSSLLRL